MILIALLVFGVFVSYTFIGFQTSKFQYAADFDYVLFKFRVLLGTISLGYFTAILSNFHSKIPVIGGWVNNLPNIVAVKYVRTIMAVFSVVWLTFALAMLPFNHTVFNAEDGSVHEEKSRSLTQMHQLVYGLPFYLLFVFFVLNLFVFLLAMCVRDEETEAWKEGNEGWSAYPPLQKLGSNFPRVKSTLGCYFYLGGGGDDYEGEDGGEGEGGPHFNMF